jgi:hypothetical protein
MLTPEQPLASPRQFPCSRTLKIRTFSRVKLSSTLPTPEPLSEYTSFEVVLYLFANILKVVRMTLGYSSSVVAYSQAPKTISTSWHEPDLKPTIIPSLQRLAHPLHFHTYK